MPLNNSFKRMIDLGIKPTKYVKELDAENYKAFTGEIKDLNTWRNNSCSCIM